MESQAAHKYATGDYTLGRLDENGQRISICIELKRRDRPETVTYTSGWMVEPNGSLKLNTPYGWK